MNVMELFAGVGGFRLGLERADKEYFKTVYMNQWEPEVKTQSAFNCYKENFKSGVMSNEDIGKVDEKSFEDMNIELIVGGFPCQDYSVARSAKGKQGIEGKKGVLFWDIMRLVGEIKPKNILLENVDRLLITPAEQRGRDFAIMLAAFRDLGYYVEWRVIDASHYGGNQSRKRVFIYAVREGEYFANKLKEDDPYSSIFEDGFFGPVFPVTDTIVPLKLKGKELGKDIVEISDTFIGNFKSAGIMVDGKYYTVKVKTKRKNRGKLGNVLEDDVSDKYYLTEDEIKRFKYLRGRKEIERVTSDGFRYLYKEGKMSEVDKLHKPSRTILTSEGTVNRTTHVVDDSKGRRYLTPLECERLNNFPDNWTKSIPDRMRYFTMGNALDVSLVEHMGERLKEINKVEIGEVL